ncbi:hypothetical protein FQA39_LY18051 [Lamprigera yunnana]|nr:hypothetical protein FQA39_LY18051 [Lamprigera yunnana]
MKYKIAGFLISNCTEQLLGFLFQQHLLLKRAERVYQSRMHLHPTLLQVGMFNESTCSTLQKHLLLKAFAAIDRSLVDRFFGAYQFNKPVLYIRDIDLIRKITIKDFDHFTDHSSFLEENVEPLMDKNLFNLKGQRWRNMRATLSPSFSSSKMKMMFILLSDCAQEFTKYFKKQSGDVLAVEMKDAFTKFTNDAIASVAFGLKCDSLEDATNEFYLMGKKATTLGTLRSTLITIIGIFPKLGQVCSTSENLNFRNFFYRIVEETIKHREAEGLVRPDMIHLLMEARKGRYIEEDNITVDAGFASTEETKEHCVDTKRKLELPTKT